MLLLVDRIDFERPPRNGFADHQRLCDPFPHGGSCIQDVSTELKQHEPTYLVVPVPLPYISRLSGSHSRTHQIPLKDLLDCFCSRLYTTPDDRNSSLRPAAMASFSIQRRGTPAKSSERFCRLPPPLHDQKTLLSRNVY